VRSHLSQRKRQAASDTLSERQAAQLASSLHAAGAAAQKVTLYARSNAGSYVVLTPP